MRGDNNGGSSAFTPSSTLVDGARREGAVVFYGSAQPERVQGIVAAFEARFPSIAIDYQRRTSGDTFQTFLTDYDRGRSPDLVWNSAMGFQIKLINDGFAQSYASSEKSAMPRWAVWKDQGYGVTAEPFVIGYNRAAMAGRTVPTSHLALERALAENPDAFRGRIGVLDLEDSGIGFMAYAQDLEASDNSVRLYARLMASRPQVYQTNQALMTDLRQGRIDIAYNLLGSYVRPSDAATIQAVQPDDYTLITSRIAFISARAPHPNAARLLLDFMLSAEGQVLLDAGGLRSARDEDPATQPASHRPIEVGPALLADLDQMRRERLLRPWRAAIDPQQTQQQG